MEFAKSIAPSSKYAGVPKIVTAPSKPSLPTITAINQLTSGFNTKLLSPFTIAVNAPPTTIPTDISNTLPRVINFLNSPKKPFKKPLSIIFKKE